MPVLELAGWGWHEQAGHERMWFLSFEFSSSYERRCSEGKKVWLQISCNQIRTGFYFWLHCNQRCLCCHVCRLISVWFSDWFFELRPLKRKYWQSEFWLRIIRSTLNSFCCTKLAAATSFFNFFFPDMTSIPECNIFRGDGNIFGLMMQSGFTTAGSAHTASVLWCSALHGLSPWWSMICWN